MADLVAHLPAADAVLISTAVDAAARRLRDRPGEARTMEQLRADCLIAPFRQALVSGTLDGTDPIRLARSGGEPATIQISIPAAALLGLSDSPADLAGYGPIPAGEARRIASDARWQRLLTDECGRLLDVGMAYRPDRATRRLVTTRDRTCRFPGCSAPAHRCDLDHVVPYPDGPTSPGNLVSLCRRHHSLKHGHNGSDRAAVTLDDAGPADTELHWRLPSGHHASTAPTQWSSQQEDQIVIDWTRQHRRPTGSDPPEAGDR
jgi:hypothetical protein